MGIKENREEQERARGVLSAQMNAHVCCVTGTERIFKQGGQGEVGMGEDKTLPCKVPPLPSLPLCSALLTTLNAPPLLCFPLLLYPPLFLSLLCACLYSTVLSIYRCQLLIRCRTVPVRIGSRVWPCICHFAM
jgi:hypothetical protein